MGETINERVKRCRKSAGLTQLQTAEMLGVKRSTYANMEKKGNIKAETLMRLSEIFGADPKELLGIGFEIPGSAVRKMRQNNEPFETEVFCFTEKEKRIIRKMRELKAEDALMVEKIIEKFLNSKTEETPDDTSTEIDGLV